MKTRGSVLISLLYALVGTAILALGGYGYYRSRQPHQGMYIPVGQAVDMSQPSVEQSASTAKYQSVTEGEEADVNPQSEPGGDPLDESYGDSGTSNPVWKDYYGQLETALNLVSRPASELADLGEPVQEKYLPLGMRLADGYIPYKWQFTQAIGDQYSGYEKTIVIRAAVNKKTKTVDAVSVDLGCDNHWGEPEPYTRPTVLEVARVVAVLGDNAPSSQRFKTYGKYGGMVLVNYRPISLYIHADYLDGSPVKNVTKTDFASGQVAKKVVWRSDFSLDRTRVKRVYFCPGESKTGQQVFLTNEEYGYSTLPND